MKQRMRRKGRVSNPGKILDELIRSGELEKASVEGLEYLSPADFALPESALQGVRLLAPFDPIVWDRRRFEHLWNWEYRFEAYTPAAKRVRGYYALPLLWDDRMIGWANASLTNGELKLDLGFVGKRPADRRFRRELEEETLRFRQFLVSDRE